jgi:hypothetical protein
MTEEEKQQVPPPRSPGFLVESCGADEVHAAHLAGEIFGDRAVESHISPKTSEMWGTQVLLWGKVVRALMGLRPFFINPRTLVRTWGTQTELV